MSKITETTDALNAKLDRIGTAVTGVAGDVAQLKVEIQTLRDQLGTLSPDDQAALDAVLARVETIASSVEALDAETPAAA